MLSHVTLEMGDLHEGHVADGALERAFSSMGPGVAFEVALVRKCLWAVLTLKRLLTRVNPLVRNQVRPLECHITAEPAPECPSLWPP